MNWNIYGWCVLGVGISVLLPILWAAVYRYFPKPKEAGPAAVAPVLEAFLKLVLPYLLLGLASAVTALLIVALSGDTLSDFRAALLAGYAWDSTLQKFRK
jgi:hypothetical protein